VTRMNMGAENSQSKEKSEHLGKGTSFLSFLNSPFVVTLLGGLMVAWATHLWQKANTDAAYSRSIVESSLRERRAAARDFADHIGSALYYSHVVKVREIWIRNALRTGGQDKFPDGRKFDQERAYYEASAQRMLANSTESLSARVAVTFTSSPVQNAINTFNRTMDKFMSEEQSVEALQKSFDVANTEYENVILSMMNEVAALEHSTPGEIK
jgi:uncharacterized surface anchored protein